MTTVIIALAAVIIGFIIGFIVGSVNEVNESISSCTHSTETKNPVKTFNSPPNVEGNPFSMQVVKTRLVLPKRIKATEYYKRVNAALKNTIDQAVFVWCDGDNNEKRQVANSLFAEWHVKLPSLTYSNYDPKFQRLDIIGRYGHEGFVFDTVWSKKNPDDYQGYLKGAK